MSKVTQELRAWERYFRPREDRPVTAEDLADLLLDVINALQLEDSE